MLILSVQLQEARYKEKKAYNKGDEALAHVA